MAADLAIYLLPRVFLWWFECFQSLKFIVFLNAPTGSSSGASQQSGEVNLH